MPARKPRPSAPRSSRLGPRKLPTQERSRATVDRIFEATARVLIARGYDGASTNHIAEAAGVSPGSLYQYFPNKDAIVIAMTDLYVQELIGRFAAELTDMLDSGPRDLIHTVFGAIVDAMSERPELLRAITDEIPRRAGIAHHAAARQRIADITRAYLLLHRDTLSVPNLDGTIWIILEIAEHLCIRYVIDNPPIPRDEFVATATALGVQFLLPDG